VARRTRQTQAAPPLRPRSPFARTGMAGTSDVFAYIRQLERYCDYVERQIAEASQPSPLPLLALIEEAMKQ
jgi:hypothetical protein